MTKLFIYFTDMKILWVISLFILFTGTLQAQAKLGLKFSPAIASNRISNGSDSLDFETYNNAIRFMGGLTADFFFTDSYAFSTGLLYVPKRVAFRGLAEDTQGSALFEEEYRVHYLQIPLSLKLLTNEIQPDTKLYFQIGGAAEVKIFDEPFDEQYDFVESFFIIDANVLLSAGVEYAIGINTTLTGGISYYRGLLNAIDKSQPIDDPLVIRNDMITVDLGIKF